LLLGRRRWNRCKRRLRGIGRILGNSNASLLLLSESRLLTRPLGLRSQLSSTSSHRFLTNGTHDREERARRNRNVYVCENACDS